MAEECRLPQPPELSPKKDSKPGSRITVGGVPKPPKLGRIMAPYLSKAIIPHTFGVQVGSFGSDMKIYLRSFF